MTDPATRAPVGGWGLSERRLYLCTPDRPDLGPFVEACIIGGVDVVQLREKHLADSDLLARARIVQAVCARHHIPFVLNDRPDLARAVGADGVHVGQDDMPAEEARRVVGDHGLVGLSTHGSSELQSAIDHQLPVDYLSAGPVLATPTKPGRPGTGLGYIREAVARSPWPVWITGGVDPECVGDLIAVGARHFVVVRWLTEAEDPGGHARQLRHAIDTGIEKTSSTT
ncbi:MAG TPA: thiamine phosphate synthase [Acidimicrobiales bacterium]|nr:thiamine phosphate synthase [Acidimicrobiales bacterium]